MGYEQSLGMFQSREKVKSTRAQETERAPLELAMDRVLTTGLQAHTLTAPHFVICALAITPPFIEGAPCAQTRSAKR